MKRSNERDKRIIKPFYWKHSHELYELTKYVTDVSDVFHTCQKLNKSNILECTLETLLLLHRVFDQSKKRSLADVDEYIPYAHKNK